MSASAPEERRPVVTPTRIIPPGAPVPLPPGPPGPDDVPPWWSVRPGAPGDAPPPPPATPGPPPAADGPGSSPSVIEVRVTLLPTEPAPEPGLWERLRAQLAGIAPAWKLVGGLVLPLLPIPGVGHSIASVWATCVTDIREGLGAPHGYALALITLTVSARALVGTRALRWVAATTTSLIGLLFGALDPFDLVTITTGVHR
ncbi:hypothetical protein [Streptomyces sp. NPDC090026]|uniref:hypothetical protein n=1 Tax=Streptomyces sp. NPDC090026 TaxID=3365923 RepID=UPI0037FCF235